MPALTCALVEKLETIADPRRQCENLKHPLVRHLHRGVVWDPWGV